MDGDDGKIVKLSSSERKPKRLRRTESVVSRDEMTVAMIQRSALRQDTDKKRLDLGN